MGKAKEFLAIINNIHGFYMDMTQANLLFQGELKHAEIRTIEMLKKDHPELATEEYVNNTIVAYGTENPNLPGSYPLQQSTRKDVTERNKSNGTNIKLLGNMIVITIYQLWEDKYREILSNELGFLDKNNLKSDIFGDLRHLRNSIVHNNGIAIGEITKCKVFKWFQPSDEIVLNFDKVNTLILTIRTEINLIN